MWCSYEDASTAACGCLTFLREVTRDDRVIVKFVCSKSGVAPLKKLTFPDLELLGCLLPAMLSKQENLDLQKFVTLCEITWQFIAPHALWWGGFYERLMRSIKEPLRKILCQEYLSFDDTTTIHAEIELVLNQRPLTYASNDLNEPLHLTPTHFMFPGKKNLSYPVHIVDIFSNEPSTRDNLSRRIL
ncbi:integrase catalytic domain-containing protein [Nephila pilipes]|uniref:Integrase catalytic domain-containing protein n=1 Tax=Nephila pilipes TaxID=299642 RepID=A0A8X6UGH9_NEPPI|nr:integrase catalytic domain-containing protein [Nephila pilipes]